MFYTGKDATQFLAQTEYIDTALIPLIPISFTKETIQQTASQADYLLSLVNALEAQFKGRVVAFPSFSYTDNQDLQALFSNWQESMHSTPFKHIIYLTADRKWGEVDTSILWTASIPLDSMDSKMRGKIIDDQLRQLIPRIAEKWTA